MSSDAFEKNVEALIRGAALRPDEARARERFLQAVDAPSERPGWKIAAAAAALLVAVTIVWSARTGPLPGARPGQSTTKPPKPEPWSGRSMMTEGGDLFLRGGFVLRGRIKPPKVIFRAGNNPSAQPPFPDGTAFLVRVQRLSDKVEAGRIVSYVRESESGSGVLEKGEFFYDWEYKGPVRVQAEVSAPDHLQERDLLKTLKVPESKRAWTFRASIWNQDVLWRLEPQFPEATDLARELRGLVDRVEEAVASEKLFLLRQKALVAEAQKIYSRASAFGEKGLFPASLGVVELAARDLTVLLPLFAWEDGKFAGPRDYHANGKPAKTFRGDPFAFEAYRRYLDEAVRVAGREVLLWILRDARVSALDEEYRKLLRDHALKPGVEDFAQRMLRLDVFDNDPTLEAEIRVLGK